MAYSTITRKKCKCGKYPVLGLAGHCWSCVPEEIKTKVGNKRDLARKKKNSRLSAIHKVREQERAENGQSDKILWYLARRYEMTGVCMEKGCRNTTNKESDKYFTWSICHVVPKSVCPSVAFHSQNWIELCQDHHHEFDKDFDSAAKMACFEIAKRMFQRFKDLIPNEELRKVNPKLL